MEIDRKSFTVPWPEEAFYNDITNNRFAIYLLLELEKDIAGYCGMWLVLDEAHVTNVAILPEYRGRKLGGALMEKMMLLAKDSGAKTMTLEVRVGNEVAKSLYKKMGFQEGGIREKLLYRQPRRCPSYVGEFMKKKDLIVLGIETSCDKRLLR